jgi:hypothetical protein
MHPPRRRLPQALSAVMKYAYAPSNQLRWLPVRRGKWSEDHLTPLSPVIRPISGHVQKHAVVEKEEIHRAHEGTT